MFSPVILSLSNIVNELRGVGDSKSRPLKLRSTDLKYNGQEWCGVRFCKPVKIRLSIWTRCILLFFIFVVCIKVYQGIERSGT